MADRLFNPDELGKERGSNAAFTEMGGREVPARTPAERYRIYQYYSRDKARVDSGGKPRAGMKASYRALSSHISNQFEALSNDVRVPTANITSSGYSDYQSAESMVGDMRKGSFTVNKTTPDQSSVAWDDATNDKFRVVHDVLAHGGAGADFSPAGESKASRSQMTTVPGIARRALSSEVEGQAAMFEFGGRQFVDQKGLYAVPRWASEERSPSKHTKTYVSRAKQQKLF